MAEPYVILNDAADVTESTATYKITGDSYDVYHPVNSVIDGINSPIFVVGVPYYTRWIDYQVYTEVARDALNKGLIDSLGAATIVAAPDYLVVGMSCTESLFVGDANPIQVWRYHIEFVKSADISKDASTAGAVSNGYHGYLIE